MPTQEGDGVLPLFGQQGVLLQPPAGYPEKKPPFYLIFAHWGDIKFLGFSALFVALGSAKRNK